MNRDLTIGRAIRVARVSQGLRQFDLARLLNISTSTLSLIENDLRGPRRSELVRIIRVLGPLKGEREEFLKERAVPTAVARGR